jgi:hypothetical protein
MFCQCTRGRAFRGTGLQKVEFFVLGAEYHMLLGCEGLYILSLKREREREREIYLTTN